MWNYRKIDSNVIYNIRFKNQNLPLLTTREDMTATAKKFGEMAATYAVVNRRLDSQDLECIMRVSSAPRALEFLSDVADVYFQSRGMKRDRQRTLPK